VLHDPAYRASLRSRVAALKPDTPRQWGKMTIDQMLWHLNAAFDQSLGRLTAEPVQPPLPRAVLKLLVFNLPWGKGRARTLREFVATGKYDFATEHARTLRLIDEFATRDLTGSWPNSAMLGPMSGQDWSRLQAKHVDHHLKQFGA